jgi:hypothetical protein
VGIQAAFAWGSAAGQPFFEKESPAGILADLRQRMAEAGEEGNDRLLFARLFLSLAQEFDLQQLELRRGLEKHERLNAQLLRAVRGKPPHASSATGRPGTGGDDGSQGGYRAADRLAAWSRLFLHRPYPSPAFVTPSAELMAHLIDTVPELLRVNPEVGARIFDRQSAGPASAGIEALAVEPAGSLRARCKPRPAGSEPQGPVPVSVYAVVGVPPLDFFARFASQGRDEAACAPRKPPWRHTLILLPERPR